MLVIIYIVSVIYCMWRLITRYKNSFGDGVIGSAPALDLLGVLFLAPILAGGDIIVTCINKVRKRRKSKSKE